MRIDVHQSNEAVAFINSARKEWAELYEQCAWGTVLQSIEFVTTWYEIYQPLFDPLVVAGFDAHDQLCGLLLLAVSKEDGKLVAAGSNQAEYEVWLATQESNDEFISHALLALSRRYPNSSLRFLFLPPNTPVEWLKSDPTWSRQTELRSHSRGLMRTDDAEVFRQSLKKKGRKSPLRRLERHGAVSFTRLRNEGELAAVFDEITIHGDSRLLAAHNVSPAHDPFKKEFHLALMGLPRIVHATVMRVGERLAAANIGLYNKDQVILGMFTHSPFLAEYSPGKLHLLMLGIELAEEGVSALDLTPGGDYKNRFATDHDEAYVLDVFFNRAHYRRYKAKRKMIGVAKRVLQTAHVTPAQAAETLGNTVNKLRHLKPATVPVKVFGRIRKRVNAATEFRVYTFNAEQAHQLPNPQLMQRDSLEDLLAYERVEAWQPSAQLFMRQAHERLSQGCHVYTRVENGTLLHWGWLIERQAKSHLTEVGQDFYPLANSALLFDYYSHPKARGKGLYQSSLRQMLHDAAQIPGTERMYITVLADNHASRHVIEKVGFKYEYSFFSHTKFGRTRRWSEAPDEVTRPRTIT